MGHYFNAGLAKMSGVAMLLVGTGALSGIISNSGLKDVIISFIETLGLPGFMLAPISGMLMARLPPPPQPVRPLPARSLGLPWWPAA